MKIGILQAGHSATELDAKHGDFDHLFHQLLKDQGFEFRNYSVEHNNIPSSVTECDGWLITGSRHSAYDDLPWIPPFEDFLRATYEANVPIVGICFGHQILAKALGGTVEKFVGGWSVGPQEYTFDGIDTPVTINAWHQDQVSCLPKGASVVGTSDVCEYAAILYEYRAFTIQAHPEFHNEFISDLVELRKHTLSPELVRETDESLKVAHPSPEVAQQIISFFKSRKLAIVSN